MANRHLSRSIILQTLFEWDFNGKNPDIVLDSLKRNIDEFGSGAGDEAFIKKVALGVVKKHSDLDKIIEKAAPDWPLQKIANVDRNVLRLGLYELLFSDRVEVPAKVAINEAIELAKTFGGETSGKFINGVLGAVYKELGEPGKEDGIKKKVNSDIPYEQMPIDKLVGSVVFAEDQGNVYLGFVHDVFGHWTLAKGHMKEGESEEDTVKRKVLDEMGAEVIEVIDKLGEHEYIASHPKDGKIRKQVSYYLAHAKYADLKLGQSGGLDDAKWFKLTEILDLNFYDDILPMVTKSLNILASRKKS